MTSLAAALELTGLAVMLASAWYGSQYAYFAGVGIALIGVIVYVGREIHKRREA